MKLKCIIVDDEELALNVLENYIDRISDLELVGRFGNAVETLSFLRRKDVGLMFLDINMPEISGMEMLGTLKDQPMVILTTAYSEYAVESYEHEVIDYLLKPISFERFVKAVNKALLQYGMYNQDPTDPGQVGNGDYFFMKHDGITQRFDHNDVCLLESYGNYVKIHTTDRSYTIRATLQDLEHILPSTVFIRVHKSYLVNISKISKVSGNRIFINFTEVPIGATYKQFVMQKIISKGKDIAGY